LVHRDDRAGHLEGRHLTSAAARPIEVGFRLNALPPLSALRDAITTEAAAGAASFWWPDHLLSFHVPELWEGEPRDIASLHRYLDPFICMAACSDVGASSFLGVSVTDAVRRMPATLAQTALSLDHLAPGRIVLGLGAGEVANYRPYGWDVASPATRLEEAAVAIRAHFDGPGPDEKGAVMGIRPAPGSPGPQLWLAAHGPRGFDVTGRTADGWLPYHLEPDEWKTGRSAIHEAAVAAGRDPDHITLGLSVNSAMADDHATAHRALDQGALRVLALLFPLRWYRERGLEHPLGGAGLHNLVAPLSGPSLAAAAQAVPFELLHDLMPHGTPAEVAAWIRRFDGLQHIRLADYGPVVLPELAGGTRERKIEVLHLLRDG
jgi:phthiodiolone/phenolphthiodiolone dimycocerosates ketoreductase